MNLCDWIEKWADQAADKPALIFGERSYTYLDFAAKVAEYAARLQNRFGIGKGDRIAFLGLNSPHFLFLMFACARIGAIITPLNWRLAGSELRLLAKHADPSLLIADLDMQPGWAGNDDFEGLRLASMEPGFDDGWEYFFAEDANENTEKLADCADDPLLLVYTSGTTGQPKGALLTHRALRANAENSEAMHRLRNDDHCLVGLPFFHVGGLNILTTPTLFVGGTVTLHRTFDAQNTLEGMTSGSPTRVPIVSAQMPPILGLPGWRDAQFPELRSVTTGASPVSPNVYAAWQEKGVTVLQVYGATETCPIAISTSVDDEAPNIRTTGRAAVNCEVKIVDENMHAVSRGEAGEILIKGDNLMSGYWRNQPATAEALRDGWYASGDIGYQDDQGYYYIVDRKKDLIISGGENIYPAEIEKLLLELDGIAEVAVIGRQDERWGEVPVAVIRLEEGIDLSEVEILNALDNRIGRYKMPKAVYFVADFPRNSVGKIRKFELRDRVFRV